MWDLISNSPHSGTNISNLASNINSLYASTSSLSLASSSSSASVHLSSEISTAAAAWRKRYVMPTNGQPLLAFSWMPSSPGASGHTLITTGPKGLEFTVMPFTPILDWSSRGELLSARGSRLFSTPCTTESVDDMIRRANMGYGLDVSFPFAFFSVFSCNIYVDCQKRQDRSSRW